MFSPVTLSYHMVHEVDAETVLSAERFERSLLIVSPGKVSCKASLYSATAFGICIGVCSVSAIID